MRAIAAFLYCLATGGTMSAQEDLRDVVTLKDGKELRGRVVDPFASTEIVLMQGGKRVRALKRDIAGTDLVTARVREFLQRRELQQDNPKLQWFLVEWARAHELPGIARLQALQLVLADDGDDRAHEYLGHKRSGKNWLWGQDGKWSTREQ
ncbi:MAG TPA: hypothetical protein VK348_15990, partial [Planctomycetota bacterium]|nr:hypothetical protein [Planctomycetota bacterium]